MDQALFALTLATAVGSALIAGVFFAFSSFVMSGLARLPPAQGIAAMNSINVTVINPVFLGVFVGTAGLSLLLVAASLWRWQAAGSGYLLGGSALYLVGTFLVTRAFNIPRNDALAALDPNATEAATRWAAYVSEWTAWNHVRAAAALLAAAALIAALWRLRPVAG